MSGLLVAGTSAFRWLVTVLTSTHLLVASSADLPGALGVLPYFPMVVRKLAVGPGFSYASCLPFALLRALGIPVHLASLLHYGSLPSRWGRSCGVEDCLSSIGTKVWSLH